MVNVFDKEDLLALILWHAGALSPCHVEYRTLFGYNRSQPADWSEESVSQVGFEAFARCLQRDHKHHTFLIDRRRRWQAAVLVCTSWHCLNTSERGREAWAALERMRFETQLSANRRAAVEPRLPWLYRLCAMSAINDEAGLRAAIGDKPPHQNRLFGGPSGVRWGGRGLASAVRHLHGDYDIEEDEEEAHGGGMPLREERILPVCESFPADRSSRQEQSLRELVTSLFAHPDWGFCSLDACDIGESDGWEGAVLAACALNAAMAGATQAVRYLLSLDERLPFLEFNQKGDHAYGHAVEYACEHACLEAPVAGVKALREPVVWQLAVRQA